MRFRWPRIGSGRAKAGQDLSDYEQSIVDNVAEHGWFCVSVFDPDDVKPSFSYSVGFWKTLNSPEVIIFGLPGKLMHSMLWEMFRQIRDGAQLEDGRRWSNLIEGFDCISHKVHPDNMQREYFNSALWYWGDPEERGAALEAYQLVWPGSKDGLFPWQVGCAQIVRDYQPALYVPPEGGMA